MIRHEEAGHVGEFLGPPDAVIAKIHAAVVDALDEPAIREKLATQLMEPIPTTPAQFRAKIDADLARWSPIIKTLNLRIN